LKKRSGRKGGKEQRNTIEDRTRQLEVITLLKKGGAKPGGRLPLMKVRVEKEKTAWLLCGGGQEMERSQPEEKKEFF